MTKMPRFALLIVGWGLLLGLCVPVSGACAHENPMVAEAVRTVESQLGDLSALPRGKKLGVLVITLANPYWTEMRNRYGEWSAAMGVEIEVMAAPTEGDLKSQLDTLEAMVAKDYDAIVVTPMDPFNLIPGVLKANEKGTPIVCSGPAIDAQALKDSGGRLNGWISAAFTDQGRLAAEDMVKRLGAVGSLSRAVLRWAGRPDGTVRDGCFEIVSLIGTIDAAGEHLHMTVSDPEGRVEGGHVLEGCVVRTTLELVVGELTDVAFRRERCPLSGYEELVVVEN